MQEEIRTANDIKSNTPISNYIRKLGRHNTGVFVLQKIDDENLLDYYERKWIHRLETHVNKKNKPALNKNWEHMPLLKKYRKNKMDKNTNNQNHENVIAKHMHTIIHIAKFPKIADRAPTVIKNINLANLYKILSICTGKIIKHRPHIINNEEHNICLTTHNTVLNMIGQEMMQIISIYITEEMCNIFKMYKEEGIKSKKAFKAIQICTVTYLGNYHKTSQMAKIMNRNLHLIKDAMPYMKKPKIIHKNPKNNGAIFMNHKKAAMELKDKNTFKNMGCKCLYMKNEMLKRDGHINTGNMEIVRFIIHKEPMIEETINELKLGVKFIQSPT